MPPPRFTAWTSGKPGSSVAEELDQLAHVVVELARSAVRCRRARAARRSAAWRRRPAASAASVLVPDAVLRGRAAGVARLHVPVAEARVDAQGDRTAVAGAAQLVDHPRRADVGQHAVLEHHGQRVVAEHVGGQHHDRRLAAHREAGAPRAQHLVAADGVDPQPRGAHRLQHLAATSSPSSRSAPAARAFGQRGQRRQAPVHLVPVIQKKRRAHLIGESGERIRIELQRRHGREI